MTPEAPNNTAAMGIFIQKNQAAATTPTIIEMVADSIRRLGPSERARTWPPSKGKTGKRLTKLQKRLTWSRIINTSITVTSTPAKSTLSGKARMERYDSTARPMPKNGPARVI